MFITDSLVADKNDLNLYHETSSIVNSMYGGKLLRIDLSPFSSRYIKLMGASKDTLFISDAIKISSPMLNSEHSSKYVKIEKTLNHTLFTWESLPS